MASLSRSRLNEPLSVAQKQLVLFALLSVPTNDTVPLLNRCRNSSFEVCSGVLKASTVSPLSSTSALIFIWICYLLAEGKRILPKLFISCHQDLQCKNRLLVLSVI
ncbi:hypothetical protein F2P81_018323 [Scophthalmus maximus]|uniref:Uncharacterized protein n=1 Tax=Scophthalmus maximus TaxID=52904 RepID=A0A6A4SAD1_SCOMX|nr:hypothetical protein F2P81_018323 [Scophthalmus maximus]